MSRVITLNGFLIADAPVLTAQDMDEAIERRLISGAPCPLAVHIQVMKGRKAIGAGRETTVSANVKASGAQVKAREPRRDWRHLVDYERYTCENTRRESIVRLIRSEPTIEMLAMGAMPPLSEAITIPNIRMMTDAEVILHILR